MGWVYPGFSHRVHIRVNAASVPADLADPALIIDLETHLAGQTTFWNTVRSDGGDIRVTTGEDDNETKVPVEVVWLDTAGTRGQIAIRWAGTLSGTGVLPECYIYFGNAGATTLPDTDPLGRNAVWAEYWFVGHMTNADQVDDSSGNYGLAVAEPGPGTFTLVAGVNGSQGVAFNDVTNEVMRTAVVATGAAAVGTSLLVHSLRDLVGGNKDALVLHLDGTTARMIVRQRDQSTDQARFRAINITNTGVNVNVTGGLYDVPSLVQSRTASTTSRTHRVENGARVSAGTAIEDQLVDRIAIGNDIEGGGSSPWGAAPEAIYEVRYANFLASDDHEILFFNNLQANGTFWTFQILEAEPVSGQTYDASGTLQVTVLATVSSTATKSSDADGTLGSGVEGLLPSLLTATAFTSHSASDQAGIAGLGVDPATLVGVAAVIFPQDLDATGNLIAQACTIVGGARRIEPGVLNVSSKSLYPQVLQGNPAVILARILGIDGNFIVPEIVDLITYEVYDVTGPTPTLSIFSGTEDPLTAILPAPDPTDPRWKKDNIGPNFISEVPGAAFPFTTRHTRIEYAFTLATLEVIRYKRDLEVVDLIAIPG